MQKLGLAAVRIPLHAGSRSTSRTCWCCRPTAAGRATGHDAVTCPSRSSDSSTTSTIARCFAGSSPTGNVNFGASFCYAGDVDFAKCGVPYLYRFELMGTATMCKPSVRASADFWKDETCHQSSQLQSL